MWSPMPESITFFEPPILARPNSTSKCHLQRVAAFPFAFHRGYNFQGYAISSMISYSLTLLVCAAHICTSHVWHLNGAYMILYASTCTICTSTTWNPIKGQWSYEFDASWFCTSPKKSLTMLTHRGATTRFHPGQSFYCVPSGKRT